MSETYKSPIASEVNQTIAHMNVAELVDFAQAGLDYREVQPEGDDQTRLFERDLLHAYGMLRETINGDTGLKNFEYSEVRYDDPDHKITYQWNENGGTITKLFGSADDDTKPRVVRAWKPSTGDTTMLRGRINMLTNSYSY